MKISTKLFSLFTLLTLLMLTFTTPALAFDGRGGENIVIKANEVIDDDVYVGANTFVIGNDLVFGGGQALIAGSVSRNILAGTSALELRGTVGGNVGAYVDITDKTKSAPPMRMYGSDLPISLPSVPPGLTIADSARIAGNLEYTSSMDLPIASGVVAGKVIRTQPEVRPGTVHSEPTAAQLALKWSLNLLRSIITLILFGLLLGWLVPSFMKNVMLKLQTKPAASFGWGIVAYAAFFFAILLVAVVMIIGGLIFGLLTLGSLSGTIIWVGLATIFELIIGFVLVAFFLTKILVAWLGGKWIINRLNPALVDHKLWPLALGVVIIALVIALPYVGWLFGLITMFLGLGALWIWGQDLWQARKTA